MPIELFYFYSHGRFLFIFNLFLIGIYVLENNVFGFLTFYIHPNFFTREFEMYILEQDVFSIQYVNVIMQRFYRQLPHRKSGGIIQGAAPALLTGNTIVVKPSQLTPENAYVFAQIVDEVGLPKGVFNLVNGRGSVIGHELAANPKVGMVSLTGSVEAGIQTMAAASANVTKVSLELGGKAPGIVMPDADLDLAVKSIIASRVINTGQVCNCCERVYVHSSIKEAFLEKLLAGFKQVKVGDPNQYTDLDMGPLIDAKALKSVEEKVKKAIEQGAELLCGGHRIGTKGYFFEPTILINCTQKMDIIQEETFGPVLPVVEFTEVEDAIAWANDCEYGLTSSIYTQNLDMAFKLIRALKFGETYVNRENFEAMQGFHAGWRKSGIGGADGKHGLEEYLQTQLVYLETKG